MKGTQAGLVAAMAVAFLTIGCGKQEGQKVASTESGTVEAGVLEQPVAATASMVQTPRTTGGESLPATADSLPPDVVASASALAAEPGQVVEITAQASTDVSQVELSDGLHKVPLVYDMEAKAWRAVYRLPMRTKADRVGLAVTATNGRGRWQRVWVFIEVGKAGSIEKTDGTGTTDSTGEKTDGTNVVPDQGTAPPADGGDPSGTVEPSGTTDPTGAIEPLNGVEGGDGC